MNKTTRQGPQEASGSSATPRYKVGDRVWIKGPPRSLNWKGQLHPRGYSNIHIGPKGPCWGVVTSVASDSYHVEISGVETLWYEPSALGDPFLESIREAREEIANESR